jgi:hypothetical protein
MKRFLSLTVCLLFTLLLLAPHSAAYAQADFVVGQKVDAGGGYKHKATVLKAEHPSYFLHYDDGSLPDGWEQGYLMRPRTGGGTPGTAAANTASSTPRNGKYSIYVYGSSGRALYNGYFVLSGSSYAVFLPGGKPGGSGQFHFDAATSTIRWGSGPFTNPDWNGTQKFEVDGINQKIRLRANTVGWSTGS